METEVQIFTYEGQEIEFDTSNPKLMVNATEMAKVFDARINNFFETESTKRFIDACLNNRNSGYLGIANRDDLYSSRQRSGTWMHRILALKFAAWLNPDFEVWVYMTIDQIIQGQQPVSISVVAERKVVIDERREAAEEAKRLEAELLESEVYQKWLASQSKVKTANATLKKLNQQMIGQLDLFSSGSN